MRTARLLGAFPAAVAMICAFSSAAETRPHDSKGGGVGSKTVTYLTPYYCSNQSDADSTQAFTTIGNHHHSTLVLQLTTQKRGSSIAYGSLTNSSNPIFSTLEFDAAGANPNSFFEISVTTQSGLIDSAYANIQNLQIDSTTSTPNGYNHFLANPSNMDFYSAGSFPSSVKLQFASLVQYPDISKGRTLSLGNVQFNGDDVTAVTQAATNNCNFLVEQRLPQ